MDTALAFADKHPFLAGFLVFLAFLVGLICLVIVILANYEMSEEEAKKSPRLFAAVVVSKRLGPVIVGIGKPIAAMFFSALANRFVNEHLGTPAPPTSNTDLLSPKGASIRPQSMADASQEPKS